LSIWQIFSTLRIMIDKILDWLIILLPFALPLYVARFNIGPLPTTALEVYVLTLMVIWFIYVSKNQIVNVGRNWIMVLHNIISGILNSIGKWFWPLIIWLVVTLFSVFIAQDSWGAFGHWRAFVLEPVIVFIVLISTLYSTSQLLHANNKIADKWLYDKREVLIKLFLSIAIITILLGIYAIFQYITGWGIHSPWNAEIGRRATGVFGYPNGLSLFIVPFGIVNFIKFAQCVTHDTQRFDGYSFIFLLATICAGIGATLSKSMGGILAFGIGIALTFIVHKKMRIIGLILTIIGILSVGLIAWQIYGTELHPQTIDDNLMSTKKWSSSVRLIIWKESWNLIKDNPFWGSGLRNYPIAIIPYHKASWMEIFPHPHNIFLMLWIETGFLGLLAFIGLIATWIIHVLYSASKPADVNGVKDKKRAIQDARQIIWIIPLIVILIQGMVDMPYFKNDLAIQFFLLATIATICSAKSTMHNAIINNENTIFL